MDKNNPHIALIIKHLTGDASVNEEQQLFAWVNENKQNEEEFNRTKKAWELAHENLDPEVAVINLDQEWKLFEKNIGFHPKGKVIQLNAPNKRRFSWLQIAAIIMLFITVGGGIIFVSQSSETELVAQNTISENKLPDGSDIVLKSQSSLTYDKNYNNKNRKVKLKGTAYFEVIPDKTKPFIVEAGNINIKVLGTSFLVKNIEHKKQAEVIVQSGRVLVYSANNESDSVVLVAGEKASFNNETKSLSKGENQNQNFLSWKTKILNFDNASLNEVVATINEVYNSGIVISRAELKQCTLTVSFNQQSLESVLKVLEATIDINVKRKGKKIVISGKGCNNENTN